MRRFAGSVLCLQSFCPTGIRLAPTPLLLVASWLLCRAECVGQGSITPDSTWTTRAALEYTPAATVRRLDLRETRSPQFDFAPFRALEAVHFGGSTLATLPSSLAYSPAREVYLERTWNLAHSQAIEQLPADHLHVLSLYNCNLRTVPPGVANLPNLRVLNLEMNHLTSFPTEVSARFRAPLQALYLGLNAEMVTFPEGVRNLRHLKVLHLDGTAIAQIEHLRGLDSLVSLGLSGLPLRRLPTQANWGSVRLHHLTLSNCLNLDWRQALEALKTQTRLRHLNVSQNDLRALAPVPPTLFPSLDTLVASNAQGIAALLPALEGARRIRYLDVSRSRLDSLSLVRVLRLETLEYLDISALDLKEIPEEVQYLRSVHTLNLQYNDLPPAAFERLKLMPALRVLRISYGKYAPEELREIQAMLPGVTLGF